MHEVPLDLQGKWMGLALSCPHSSALHGLCMEGERGQEQTKSSVAGKGAGHTLTNMITTNLCDENKQSHICWLSTLLCQFFLSHQLLKRVIKENLTWTDDHLQVWQWPLRLVYLWGWTEMSELLTSTLLGSVEGQKSEWMVGSGSSLEEWYNFS